MIYNFVRSNEKYHFTCAECGENFTTLYKHQRYCTPECKKARDRRSQRVRHVQPEYRRPVVPL